MKKTLYILVFIFYLGFLENVLAWDNEKTHRDISGFAGDNSVLSMGKGDYLKTLGFTEGLNQRFKWGNAEKTAKEWLQEGAFLEDEGSYSDAVTGKARYTNHFHNPLKPWSAAGLTDLQSGESAVLWAQNSAKQSVSLGGDWSWQKIRLYYYYALTAPTGDDRQTFFACTFKGLGYQMHLIQDMSQPAHVRNDAHPIDGAGGVLGMMEGLETWAKKNPIKINSFAASPAFPQVALNINRNGLVPITQFIDSEQYGGTMPSTSLTWGLAEYTNSNFASDDTIFTEDKGINHKHYFLYPRYSTNSYEMYEVEHSLITKRIYLRKKGEGEYIEHFATAGPLLKFLSFDPVLQKNELKLDPAVYKDYASLLIPRAVGYSAGLLNYFFRGDIDMVPDDAKGSGYVIVNNTEEDMSGSFELYYDKTSDERVKVSGGSWTLSIGKKSSVSNKSTNIVFSSPTDAKEKGKYMLVFRGKMGSETDAVGGKKVELKEKEYVFLVGGFSKTAAFEIATKDNQFQLIPATDKKVNLKHVYLNNTLLTVQSSPDKTEHMAELASWRYDYYGNIISSYNPTIEKYGRTYNDYNFGSLKVGLPQAYVPKDFNQGSPYVWDDEQFIFGERPYITSGEFSYSFRPAAYIHGRRPFKVTDEKLTARNINIRKDDAYTYYGNDYAGPFHIQYKDASWRWVRGGELPKTNETSTIAFTSMDVNVSKPVITEDYSYDPRKTDPSGIWIYPFVDGYSTVNSQVTGSIESTPLWSDSSEISPQYLAILDKDKVIYTISKNDSISEPSVGGSGTVLSHYDGVFVHVVVGNGYWYPTVTVTTDITYNYIETSDRSSRVSKTSLYAGNNLIEDFELLTTDNSSDFRGFGYVSTSKTEKQGYDEIRRPASALVFDFEDYVYSKRETVSLSINGKTASMSINGRQYTGFYGESGSVSTGKSFGGVIDYDHMDGDRYFILFYNYNESDNRRNGKGFRGAGIWGTGNDAQFAGSPGWTGGIKSYEYRETTTRYKLAYKIDEAIHLVSIDISPQYLSESSGEVTSVVNGTAQSTDSHREETSGKRITGVSSQINEKNMVYTYIVERYDNLKWIFDKRIVGIINISDAALPVGYRQEFEFLTSGASFDLSKLAAVGVTR